MAFGSKKLTSASGSIQLQRRNALPLWGISKFRLYLAGKPLSADGSPTLTYLNDAKFKTIGLCAGRWFQGYDYTVKDIPAKTMFWRTI